MVIYKERGLDPEASKGSQCSPGLGQGAQAIPSCRCFPPPLEQEQELREGCSPTCEADRVLGSSP